MAENIKHIDEGSGDVWVFTEIQDHERVLDGALELLSKGREIADTLGTKLYAVVFALDAEQYLSVIERYGPDVILYCSDRGLKHYDSQIFPDLYTALIEHYRPSIVLFPSTEAGADLAPRLAQRFSTGLTSHCTGLSIMKSDDYKRPLLVMKRPAYSGNAIATVICPHTLPQMATVQQGVFDKKETGGVNTEQVRLPFNYDLSALRITNLEAPVRWDKPRVPLEQAAVVVAGGRGLGSKRNFDRLFELAEILGGEVGSTRVPVFNNWCGEERMIGQTGKTIRPRLYLGFGISGQIQHTASIVDSEIIVSVNTSETAPIFDISDCVVPEDANIFLARLIERLRKEKRT
ncbi:MAG TPA: electron transfer flavoprotein subunit alpha/FixB family protein [Spirochaetota bacterium]|nr:electron transfer flavoprotein subunit alpha/FixB family protein [Spirochaetota bacterium]HQH96056.1 electron transfer flavoprotein subunit alpha/FixB family protein [Spirochaetota bacterium]